MVYFFARKRGSMNVFSLVKENVTARDVITQYGFKVNRSGMICCPFHKDKTPSMKVEKRFYCFGCGEKGDVIDFVAKHDGISLKEAAVKIASDFGLESDEDFRAPPKKIKSKVSKEQGLKEKQKYCYQVLAEYYHLLQTWKIKYRPKDIEEEPHPYFVEALQNISKVEYQLDTLLEKDSSDRAFVISDMEKEVKEIERRIQQYRNCEKDVGM